MIETARRLKHEALLFRRRIEAAIENRRNNRRDLYPATDPYAFKPDNYRELVGDTTVPTSWTFPVNHLLHPVIQPTNPPAERAPNVAYIFWTGENDLPKTRLTALQGLRAQNPGTSIELITPDRLPEYIVDEAPLHPAYEHLSYVHKSDYLRSYFMHFHGGVYLDLKPLSAPVLGLVEKLNSNDSVWACGPSELSKFNASPASGRLGRDQEKYFRQCISQYLFAFKPGSSWTSDWYHEVQRRMDYFEDLLIAHPAQDAYGRTGDYPVPWNSLHGVVFTPLTLKYIEHSAIDNTARLALTGTYR